jgi:hypothetical protein
MSTMLAVIGLLSLLLAAATGLIAWRTARTLQMRSDARVAALARDIAARVNGEEYGDPTLRSGSLEHDRGIFAATQLNDDESRAPFAFAAGAVIVGTAIALIVVLSGSERPAASALTNGAVPATNETTAKPLELVALAHERSDGHLTVRGVVKNPTYGPAVDGLLAVVLFMTADGREVTTLTTPVTKGPLRPDDQASFLVSMPDAAVAERYRVSFRVGSRLVSHSDARGNR